MSAPGRLPPHIDALVSGKRSGARKAVSLAVTVKGPHREFEAHAKDLSMQGTLLLLNEQDLSEADEGPLDAAAQFAFLERHLGESFDVHFHAARVVVEARLMRFTLTTEGDGLLGLGCHFEHALSHAQAEDLGLAGAQQGGADWRFSVGVHDVRREADPTRPLTALLLDQDESTRGPVFLGPVTQAGRRAVVVRLDGVAAAQAAERLAACDLQLCLARGTKRLAAAPADCVALRYVDGARPGTEVLLALPQRMPRALWRHFRRSASRMPA